MSNNGYIIEYTNLILMIIALRINNLKK